MRRLPTGISDFEEIVKNNYCYIDKTLLIKEIIDSGSKVTLFTRPRRFGKTLNMSTLKYFFDIKSKKEIFNGLNISKETEICEGYQCKYPVISISLKEAAGRDFNDAFNMLKIIIGDEASNFEFLRDSKKLSSDEKEDYCRLIKRGTDSKYGMSVDIIKDSLKNLTKLLYKHYDKKVILLIDEYDVPLDKAYHGGYYDDMISVIRGLLSSALKDNTALNFAVLTGCLRVSKESIFTGLNNIDIHSITAPDYDEFFGFTDKEIDKILEEYSFTEKKPIVKEWYDGYKFGDAEIYCPWDVINYVKRLRVKENSEPENFWANSSGNDLVREFISLSDSETTAEIERLISGEAIQKEINENITYREIDDNIDNLWSVLFSTGYLTGTKENGIYTLWIPNKEIKNLFTSEIRIWFNGKVRGRKKEIEDFYEAMLNDDSDTMENILNLIMVDAISVRDYNAKDELKENFYQGMMVGLLSGFAKVQSNRESGYGYSDILIKDMKSRTGVVLELKYSKTFKDLDRNCDEALRQISDLSYDEALIEEGMKNIKKYGIAFFKKICKVKEKK